MKSWQFGLTNAKMTVVYGRPYIRRP